jgi:dihydroneopterin aldolase
MYEIFIDEMAVVVPVGLCAHEQLAPQRLLVSLRARGQAPLTPQSLAECIDYSLAVERITAWANGPHVPLLEVLAADLLTTLFTRDPKIRWAEVTLTKPDFYPNAKGVGIRRALSRRAFEENRSL